VKGQIANAQAVVTAAQRRLETALRAKRAGFGHLLLCEYLDDPGSGGLGAICGFLATQALAQLHDVSRLQEPGRCPLNEMSEIVAAAQGLPRALWRLCRPSASPTKPSERLKPGRTRASQQARTLNFSTPNPSLTTAPLPR
jgi:hypothetical protein